MKTAEDGRCISTMDWARREIIPAIRMPGKYGRKERSLVYGSTGIYGF